MTSQVKESPYRLVLMIIQLIIINCGLFPAFAQAFSSVELRDPYADRDSIKFTKIQVPFFSVLEKKDTVLLVPGYSAILPQSYRFPNDSGHSSYIYIFKSIGIARITFSKNFEKWNEPFSISYLSCDEYVKFKERVRHYLLTQLEFCLMDIVDHDFEHDFFYHLAKYANACEELTYLPQNDFDNNVKITYKGFVIELYGIDKNLDGIICKIRDSFSPNYPIEEKRIRSNYSLRQRQEYNKPSYF